MAILITYDIGEGRTQAMKDELINNRGYLRQIPGSKRQVTLPNTTLYHPNKTTQQGYDDMIAAGRIAGGTVDRCIALQVSDWTGH